jgi:hypothetical protein
LSLAPDASFGLPQPGGQIRWRLSGRPSAPPCRPGRFPKSPGHRDSARKLRHATSCFGGNPPNRQGFHACERSERRGGRLPTMGVETTGEGTGRRGRV